MFVIGGFVVVQAAVGIGVEAVGGEDDVEVESSHGRDGRTAADAATMRRMTIDEALELVVELFEVLGVGILVVGSVASFVLYARDVLRDGARRTAYERLRVNIGRTILVGLEVLIVADIVLTVAIDQTIESALTLGPDRPRPDVPELLARDRARRCRPVASAGRADRRGRPRPCDETTPAVEG